MKGSSWDSARIRQASELWGTGCKAMETGDFDEAIDYFTRSIDVHPTAEAFTFRGWAFSFQGRVDEAIDECRKAIEVDPDFGNPYNDIGSYLIGKGQLDEAIPWLERAKSAARYEPRHFPFLNLGRVFAMKGMLNRALEEFRGALALNPDDPVAQDALQTLGNRLN